MWSRWAEQLLITLANDNNKRNALLKSTKNIFEWDLGLDFLLTKKYTLLVTASLKMARC